MVTTLASLGAPQSCFLWDENHCINDGCQSEILVAAECTAQLNLDPSDCKGLAELLPSLPLGASKQPSSVRFKLPKNGCSDAIQISVVVAAVGLSVFNEVTERDGSETNVP